MAEMPNIRELYERADWPDGEFRLSCDEILEPGGMFMGKFWESELEKARARFICEAVNYWLRHLRGAVEREKHMDTYRGAKKL